MPTRRVESQIIRPLPGHTPEGIVWAGGKIYVQERNSEDVVAFAVTRSAAGWSWSPDGAAFPTLAADPMPATLRLGQRLFYSANSDQLPLTQNHWVACASCHLEGRSDAVTWKFAQGPRDTPSNAGGMLDTGFLFRTADRNQVQDYWRTINVEQGGHFSIDNPSQKTLLDALAAFVNYAIPAPVPPSTDAAHTLQGQALADLRAQGQTLFMQLGCATCHSGPASTDSGAGNPTLDLTGPVVSTQTAAACCCTTSAPARRATSPTSTTWTSWATIARRAPSTRRRCAGWPTARRTCTTAAPPRSTTSCRSCSRHRAGRSGRADPDRGPADARWSSICEAFEVPFSLSGPRERAGEWATLARAALRGPFFRILS